MWRTQCFCHLPAWQTHLQVGKAAEDVRAGGEQLGARVRQQLPQDAASRRLAGPRGRRRLLPAALTLQRSSRRLGFGRRDAEPGVSRRCSAAPLIDYFVRHASMSERLDELDDCQKGPRSAE